MDFLTKTTFERNIRQVMVDIVLPFERERTGILTCKKVSVILKELEFIKYDFNRLIDEYAESLKRDSL